MLSKKEKLVPFGTILRIETGNRRRMRSGARSRKGPQKQKGNGRLPNSETHFQISKRRCAVPVVANRRGTNIASPVGVWLK